MKQVLMELIGTFFLVLVVGLTVIAPGAGAMAPLAIGGVLMVMVYAGGPISGGHYNPAVTLAVWMRGKHPTKDVAPYMGAQVLAAVLAALMVGLCKPDGLARAASVAVLPALLVELVFTFALAFVVLSVATSKKSAGNSYFGLAIGFTLLVGVSAGGAISGGAFNPAVAVGITLLGLSTVQQLWIFLLANFAGGALAALVYRLTNPDELHS
ncbi:MAG TPA: aquaporin [bacterium]